jgi:hypothetical protein
MQAGGYLRAQSYVSFEWLLGATAIHPIAYNNTLDVVSLLRQRDERLCQQQHA